MEIEEAGPDPVAIAAAVHARLGEAAGAVPIEAIARALGIVDIRYERTSFEGALVFDDHRDKGAIVINAASDARRQRFTLAHELGHFLSLHHQPNADGRFACSAGDLRQSWSREPPAANQHLRQEIEANRFAAELLAPPRRMAAVFSGEPDLAHVLAISAELLLSREAAARRYVLMHPRPVAILFALDNRLRYLERATAFPFIPLQRGDVLPSLAPRGERALSQSLACDPRLWLARPDGRDLRMQTLHQQDGYSMTLLALAPAS